jgi:hypothetical protein
MQSEVPICLYMGDCMHLIHPSQWFVLAACLYGLSLIAFLLKREKTSVALLGVGFLLNTAYQLGRGWHYGILLTANLVTGVYLIPWFLAIIALILRLRGRSVRMALTILVPLCITAGMALVLGSATIPPPGIKSTPFSTLFVLFDALAHACFFAAGWFAILFLVRRLNETTFNVFALWGFVAYSISQLCGAIFAYLGWSVAFHWNSKHMMSAAIWCFYCAYLHMNFSPRWSARKKSWFVLVGCLATFVITYNLTKYLGV